MYVEHYGCCCLLVIRLFNNHFSYLCVPFLNSYFCEQHPMQCVARSSFCIQDVDRSAVQLCASVVRTDLVRFFRWKQCGVWKAYTFRILPLW